MSDACCGTCETHAHDVSVGARPAGARSRLPWLVGAGGAAIGAGALAGWLGFVTVSIGSYGIAIALSIPGPFRRA
jgi:hypothetical protein